jgi:hypothetical protein
MIAPIMLMNIGIGIIIFIAGGLGFYVYKWMEKRKKKRIINETYYKAFPIDEIP